MTKLSNTFTGNIDELLDHCTTVDDETLNQALELEQSISHVMKEMDVDREEAMRIIQEIHLAELQQTLDDMVDKGLLEIIGNNENGDPLYNLTEHGRRVRHQIEE